MSPGDAAAGAGRGGADGPGGERERAEPSSSPWRTLQKGEVWSPSSRQVVSSVGLPWSTPAKGDRRRRGLSAARPRVARENAPPAGGAAAAAPSSAASAFLDARRDCAIKASLSLSPDGSGPGFRAGNSRAGLLGAAVGAASRSVSPQPRQVGYCLVEVCELRAKVPRFDCFKKVSMLFKASQYCCAGMKE